MDITSLLKFALDNGASDLHLSGGNPPIVRIDGELQRIKVDMMTGDDIRGMLYSVMTEDNRVIYERDLELDFAVSFGNDARFRVNAFTNRAGSAAVFRSIPSKMPTMDELNVPESIRRMADLQKGLVLVTGPTGSGKSTTLASMVNYINDTYQKHILTVEDPVEFFHHSKKSLVNHREVGGDTRSFGRALKSALREDPDIILVGEMRDQETIGLALTAAETGHLVFGTLHSNTAAKTIDRIIDVFESGDKPMVRSMLSSSIQGIVSQALLKKEGGGRAAAHEIMVGTNAVRNLIREDKLAQVYSMIQTGARYGMQTMEDSISDLVIAGLVSKETANEYLRDASETEDSIDEDAILGDEVDEAAERKARAKPPKPSKKSKADKKKDKKEEVVAEEDDGGIEF